MKSIVFAGGCFWGVEAYFKQLTGIEDITVGYIDGQKANPTYEEVCMGSGHAEAVAITYDESERTLASLLEHLFNIIDPTLINRQGNDIGAQYRTGIYNYDAAQKKMIDAFLETKRPAYGKPLRLELKSGLAFYEAEAYHQDYLDKNPNGYCHVNLRSVKDIEE